MLFEGALRARLRASEGFRLRRFEASGLVS